MGVSEKRRLFWQLKAALFLINQPNELPNVYKQSQAGLSHRLAKLV
jgi:hypothetical protein